MKKRRAQFTLGAVLAIFLSSLPAWADESGDEKSSLRLGPAIRKSAPPAGRPSILAEGRPTIAAMENQNLPRMTNRPRSTPTPPPDPTRKSAPAPTIALCLLALGILGAGLGRPFYV